MLAIGGVVLAATMLILSAQSSRARSAPEAPVEAAARQPASIETAAL